VESYKILVVEEFSIAASRCIAEAHYFLDIVFRNFNTSLSSIHRLAHIINGIIIGSYAWRVKDWIQAKTLMSTVVLCVVTPSVIVGRCELFGGTWCLHLQGEDIQWMSSGS
jgi:hypothetical protein